MKILNIYYEGICVFIRDALKSFVFPVKPQYEYDEIHVIDLTGFSTLSSLIVFLNRLYLIKGNVHVLLIASERSHLPRLPAFSVYLEHTLPQWQLSLKTNGRIITDVIDECRRVKNLENIAIKSRLILRQLAEGYSLEDLSEQFEINTKSLRGIMWRCSTVYGFNCTDRLVAYLMAEYNCTFSDKIHGIPVIAAEDYLFISDKKERTQSLSLRTQCNSFLI